MTRIILLWFCVLVLVPQIIAAEPGLGQGYEFENNGKVPGKEFSAVYEQRAIPENIPEQLSAEFKLGVSLNQRLTRRIPEDRVFKAGNLNVTGRQLRTVTRTIDEFVRSGKKDKLSGLKYYQIKGEDGLGNVHFTGYFTPRLEARKKPDEKFRYPVYGLPPGKKLPSRQQIDQAGALAGKGLEIAYTSSLLDNFFLSVQGSGILDYGDGKTEQIGFAGGNGHPYRSVGKMLVENGSIPAEIISLRSIRKWFAAHPEQLVPTLNRNPSYTFFKIRPTEITGAAGVPLAPMHSVAVDKSFIPYGACLLGEIPVLDDNGRLAGHELRFLFAHDTGGAIRGPGHLDLYFGTGCEAGDRAGDLHHYGRLWLILPSD